MGKLFKKYEMIFISLFFILVVLMVSLFAKISVDKYKKEVVKRDNELKRLSDTLNNIGDLQDGYVVKTAVRAGEKITEDKLQPVSVPVKLGLNVVTVQDNPIGKYFRISLNEGTVLTKDVVLDQKLNNTSRYFDLVIDETPIGLKVGDYIDVRITFPFGEDFIAISHKKVEEINSGIPKVVMTEPEIYAYQSMLVDKAIYPGSKIYAVKYFDGGAQQPAEVYYPLNKNLAEISSMNPNLLELVKQEMKLKRAQLDSKMGGELDKMDEYKLQRVTGQIEDIRREINRSMAESQRELERRLEMQAAQQQQ